MVRRTPRNRNQGQRRRNNNRGGIRPVDNTVDIMTTHNLGINGDGLAEIPADFNTTRRPAQLVIWDYAQVTYISPSQVPFSLVIPGTPARLFVGTKWVSGRVPWYLFSTLPQMTFPQGTAGNVLCVIKWSGQTGH